MYLISPLFFFLVPVIDEGGGGGSSTGVGIYACAGGGRVEGGNVRCEMGNVR